MISKTLINLIEKDISKSIKKIFGVMNCNFVVDKTKDIENGDFFTNVAMILTKKLNQDIQLISSKIIEDLMRTGKFSKILFMKGYINFYVSDIIVKKVLIQAAKEGRKYGQFAHKNLYYNIEFVSANPTGNLHIGHARNAALGQTLSNIWKKYGIIVDNEYYVNDAGAQIDKLGMSVFYRYLQICKKDVKMATDFYKGEEPKIVAQKIYDEYGAKFASVKFDKTKIFDDNTFLFFKNYSKAAMLDNIKKDLSDFRVKFNKYYSEQSIYEKGFVEKTLKKIAKHTYTKDGALWLNTTKDGDDKDRVLVKSDKTLTYFTPDICYHNIKLSRGYNKIFDVLGADHTSYVNRLKSSIKSLGFKGDPLNGIIMQMVKLTKDGEEFKMSKRSGNSLTLKDLVKAIGVDSARWALISQSANTHIDIDVSEFNNKSFDNHLYYVFYAYARIKKMIQKFDKSKESKNISTANVSLLKSNIEREIIDMIIYYPHTIETIAKFYEPHKIVKFIYTLATLLHSYYEHTSFLLEKDVNLKNARFLLLKAAAATIESSLLLLDIKPKNRL